ncbi:MAG: hypothetical protein BWX44_00589 [Spirochaetes bacterium ADurb.Bin001]|nr:MAG: hypothetical protein BWX44_00589 [Spirochaetes bacterium ADurb.Bin001]
MQSEGEQTADAAGALETAAEVTASGVRHRRQVVPVPFLEHDHPVVHVPHQGVGHPTAVLPHALRPYPTTPKAVVREPAQRRVVHPVGHDHRDQLVLVVVPVAELLVQAGRSVRFLAAGLG